ncbi:MAG TPA: MlaD family protein, partial [bacterium]|nr:MlaD family protein [bacterium]
MFTHYFKVGIGVLVAIAILFVAYKQVQENRLGKNESYNLTVTFDNVQGVTAGNDVWLSGIKIGSIKTVKLRDDGTAELELMIDKKYKIHKGSRFSIKIGFLEDKILSIEKPLKITSPYKYYKDGDKITRTDSPATIQDLIEESDRAIYELRKTLENARKLSENEQLKQNILETTNNVAKTTAEAYEFLKMLHETGTDNRDEVETAIANVKRITDNFVLTSQKLDKLISNANDVAGDETFKKQVKEIVAEMKSTMDNIDETTKSVREIITDDQVKTDVKETIRSTRSTMENADQAISSFSHMIRAINDTEIKPDFEFRYDGRDKKFIADMNLRVF